MNIAAKARAAAMGFEVKKDAVRQVQCGDWRLTLTVAAADMPVRVITAQPGTRYMLAIVEIGDDEQPVSSTPSVEMRPAKGPPPATPEAILSPLEAGGPARHLNPSSIPSVSLPEKQATKSAPVEVIVREAPLAEGAGRPKREPPCPTTARDPLVTYVCMSCGVPRFQAWLKSYVDLSGDLDHQGAIHCVHQLLGVKSRGEISTNPVARQKALDLMGAYDIAIGRHAEDRG